MGALGADLRGAAARWPTSPALTCGPVRWSYRQLDARADAWARWLAGTLPAGAAVATLCRSGAEPVALLYGCARHGAVLAPLSHRLTAAELARQLDDAGAPLLLHDAAHASLAAAAVRLARRAPQLVELPGPNAPMPRPAQPVPVNGVPPPPPGPEEERAVLLMYTSGSTGAVRGVPLRQRHVTATDDALDAVARLTPTDVVLQLLPQYHVAGWTVLPLLAVARGAQLVVLPDFDPGDALAAVTGHRVTVTMAVPTMYRMLARAPLFAAADLSSLRLAISGGAALPPSLLSTWLARGVTLCQGYGLTEAGPNVLCVPPSDVHASAGSVGTPYPGVEVALDDASGELLVRGPGVFDGYWSGDPPALHRGWLRTGDIAERDARGWYRIVDRLDEMYVSGGENVAPAEVEAVLREHPTVADVAVVGVPDDTWGQAGVAFTVPAAGADVDGTELRAHCRAHLAGYKVPRRVVTVDRLPRAGIGKVRRDVLRALAVGAT